MQAAAVRLLYSGHWHDPGLGIVDYGKAIVTDDPTPSQAIVRGDQFVRIGHAVSLIPTTADYIGLHTVRLRFSGPEV